MLQMDCSNLFSPIFTLPVEIFNHIFDYLRDDLSNLCHVASASRQLRDVVAPIIYQDVSLLISLRYLTTAKGSSWQLDQILQNITSNRELGTYVRSAYIRDNRFETNSDGTITTQMTRLLTMFPKLQNLRINRDEHRKQSRLNMNFLEYNPMSFLRTVCIEDRTLSSTDLVRLMLLERVESVTATNFEDSSSPAIGSRWLPAKMKKRPVSLHLKRSGMLPVQVHGNVLRDILDWAPTNLNVVSCFIPGLYPESGIAATQSPPAPTSDPTLSPKLLQNALEPVQQILEQLQVSRGGHGIKQSGGAYVTRRLDTDGSQADFSGFANLQDLDVNSACLFPIDEHPSHRQHAFKLLPRPLEKLKIHFDEDCGLLWRNSEDWYSTGKDRLSWLNPSHYRWLTEIIEHKAKWYPNLTRVEIREEPKDARITMVDPKASSRGFQWTIPSDLQEMADTAGITIDVWLESHNDESGDVIQSTREVENHNAEE